MSDVDAVAVIEGEVIRFLDRDAKRRPAIVVFPRNHEVVVIEGTTVDKWKHAGEQVLLEVQANSALCHRLGLMRWATTYFYGGRSRLKIIPRQCVITGRPLRLCPDMHLRRFQTWAQQILVAAQAQPIRSRSTPPPLEADAAEE